MCLLRGKRALVKDAAWASLVGALYGGVILVGFAQMPPPELMPLPVAAVIAYGRLIGDATDVRVAVLQDRLDRIALALSAVCTVYSGDASEDLLMRKSDLPAAIDTLRRAGVAFNG